KSELHTLVRLPSCAACGHARPQADQSPPVEIQSRKKASTHDGGHRATPPEEVLARYGHHVSLITGAVSVLERWVPSQEGGVHVYFAGHNWATRQESLADLRAGLRGQCSGKGTSDVQARASALGEAIERASGIYRGDEPRRRARLPDLGDAA